MHAKIHTATSVLCVHFQFSFHLDGEVTHALSARKAVVFLVYFKLKPPVKSRFLKKPTKRFDGGEKRRTRHTRHFFFLAHQTRATRPRLYIYIYTSHTHKFESSNHAFDDNQHLVSFGQTAFLVFLEAPHEGTTETTR